MRHCIIRVSSIQRRLQSFYSFLRCVPQLYPPAGRAGFPGQNRTSSSLQFMSLAGIGHSLVKILDPLAGIKDPLHGIEHPPRGLKDPPKGIEYLSQVIEHPLDGIEGSHLEIEDLVFCTLDSLAEPKLPLSLALQKSPSLPKGKDRQPIAESGTWQNENPI